MFGKKEEKGLPDLPPIQTPFSWKEETEESHALPSFPDSPMSKGFSQTAIKGAISETGRDLPPLPESDDVKVVEMKEWVPSVPSMENPPENSQDMHWQAPKFGDTMNQIQMNEFPSPHEMQMFQKTKLSQDRVPVTKPGIDVFVKIDKFHSAKKTLRDVGNSLEEIDSLIKKIREIKLREEQEITAWERDVLHAKARIQEIFENIFEKVE